MASAEPDFGHDAPEPLDTAFLTGACEMGDRIRFHDWAATPLGDLSGWPMQLRLAVSLCVKSQFPIIIHWGWSDPILLYNDAFIPLIGEKHPAALGTRLFESWPELRPRIEPMLESVLTDGKAALAEDLLHVYNRDGCLEERCCTVSFNPIVLDSGMTGGSLTFIHNTTGRVIGERRLRTLRDLAARSMEAKEIDEACRIAPDLISENYYDLPFVLFYLPDEGHKGALLVANVGLDPSQPASPTKIELTEVNASGLWPIAQASQTNSVQQVNNLKQKFGPCQGAFGMIRPIAGW